MVEGGSIGKSFGGGVSSSVVLLCRCVFCLVRESEELVLVFLFLDWIEKMDWKEGKEGGGQEFGEFGRIRTEEEGGEEEVDSYMVAFLPALSSCLFSLAGLFLSSTF